jgi:hypothetical protein
MSNRNYCMASAAVFALVALVHIWRFVLDLPVQIGAWSVPRSASLVGAIVAGAFAFWAFRSARSPKQAQVAYTS